MNITFDDIALPTGSVSRIASELNIEEQTVHIFLAQKSMKTVKWWI